MRSIPLLLLLLPPLAAQNLVPQGDFQATPSSWTQLAFNDPIGSTGIADARVLGDGPSAALFGNFQTLTSVRSATWRSAPVQLPAATYPLGFSVLWEKQVTTPIPYPSVNRVEFRIYDSLNALVHTSTLQSPNQTGLLERAAFTGSVTLAATDTYTIELFLRHSNLAGIPYTTWVDDVWLGSPDAWRFGTGCAGSGGFVPVVGVQGDAAVGSTSFAITAHDAFAPSLAFFLMDLSNTSAGGLPLPFAIGGGCDLLVGLSVFLPVAVTGAGSGAGTASQLLPIPANPGLANVVLFAQWAVVDPVAGNPYGVVMSRGLGFRIR